MSDCNLPEPLAPAYTLAGPGESILLHAGYLPVVLENRTGETFEERGEGNAYLRLLPSPQVSWEAFGTSADPEFKRRFYRYLFGRKATVRLSSVFDIRWLTVPPAPAQGIDLLNRVLDPEEGEFHFDSHQDGPLGIGSREGLSEVRFHLINFPFWSGNARVQYERPQGPFDNEVRPCRFALRTDDGWEIDIDAREDFQDVWKDVTQQRSYAITHVGRLRRDDRSGFHFDDADDVLKMLYWFLSFVASRRVGVVLPVGYDTTGTLSFVRWDVRITQRAKEPITWYHDVHGAEDIQSLFLSFRDLWIDPYWKEVIWQVIYTYTNAQEETRGDLMMLQSGLETLAWAVLVEEGGKRVVASEDRRVESKGELKKKFKTAAKKLRGLLEWANVPSDSLSACDLLGPTALNLLEGVDPPNDDGPAAVTWARNRVTHPKPGSLSKLTPEMRFECAWALRGYLELLLLRLFSYQGSYADRMERFNPQYGTFGQREPYWIGSEIRQGPWAKGGDNP